jgi:hypothetical protein
VRACVRACVGECAPRVRVCVKIILHLMLEKDRNKTQMAAQRCRRNVLLLLTKKVLRGEGDEIMMNTRTLSRTLTSRFCSSAGLTATRNCSRIVTMYTS